MMRIGVVARFDIDKSIELAGKIVEFLIEKDVDTLIETNLASKLNNYQDIASDLKIWMLIWWLLLVVMVPYSELREL